MEQSNILQDSLAVSDSVKQILIVSRYPLGHLKEHMFDFDYVLYGRKHPFLSDLHTCHSLCIEFESEFEFDHVSDFDAENESEFESGSDFLGVVPLDVDFLELESNPVLLISGSFDPFALSMYQIN